MGKINPPSIFYLRKVKTFPGCIRSSIVKKNNIGSAVSEIICYRQKKLTTLYHRIHDSIDDRKENNEYPEHFLKVSWIKIVLKYWWMHKIFNSLIGCIFSIQNIEILYIQNLHFIFLGKNLIKLINDFSKIQITSYKC